MSNRRTKDARPKGKPYARGNNGWKPVDKHVKADTPVLRRLKLHRRVLPLGRIA